MSHPEFIQFGTPDGLSLPGLLFTPDETKKAAIYLHGIASSVFYYRDLTLAEELAKNNIAILYFNNRGADLIKKLTVENKDKEERRNYGAAYEKIRECVEDIEGAVSFLEQNGYKEFYLIGHSTGANKICVYNYYKPQNKIAKYILLAGGDDTGIFYHQLGKEKFYKLLKEARKKVQNGVGDNIICEFLPDQIISHQSFLDAADPDGDYNVFPFYEVLNNLKLSRKPLFRHFKSISKPSLVIYGEFDEWNWGHTNRLIRILKEYQPDFDYKIISGADHPFTDKKKELAKLITDWLKEKR